MSITIDDKLRFLKRAFGAHTHDRDAVNVSVACPYCVSKKHTTKKKLVIHTQRWVFHCWKCGTRGKSIIPLLRITGRSDLVEEFVTRFTNETFFRDERDPDALRAIVSLPHDFEMLALRVDSRIPRHRAALNYLISRGVTTKDLWKFKLGVSESFDTHERVIIPSFDASGVLNYYSGRRIDGWTYAKYKNATVSRTDRVFNELNVDWSKRLVLVEGPFDLIKSPDNSVPLLGCELNEESRLFISILQHNTPVTIALDPDAMKRTLALAKKLSSYGIDVMLARVPAGKDPGSMTHSEMRDCVLAAEPWSRDNSMRETIRMI